MTNHEDGSQRARDFVQRHLPFGVRSGHDLLYGREAATFVPTQAGINRCLQDYQALLEGLRPTSEPTEEVLERIMAFEMMEANELVLAFLAHATPEAVAGVDGAAIALSIGASLAIVERVLPQFAGHDFFKRYARVRERIVAIQ